MALQVQRITAEEGNDATDVRKATEGKAGYIEPRTLNPSATEDGGTSFLVAGCASQIMSGYIGQSLQEVMLDFGTPVNAFDMPDGSRAFQSVLTSSYVLPTTIAQSGNAQASGNNLNWMSNTRITGGQPVTNTCAYTMLARWVDASNAWIFYDFRKPRFGCE